MKGDVLHYDDNVGTGQISGADGIRYSFTRADLKQLIPIGRGTKVDFDFEGKVAKDIYIDGPGGVTHSHAAAPPAYAAAALETTPMAQPEPRLGLWAYFQRAYTTRFAKFSGRARRKEYWSVVLFSTLFMLVFYAIIFAGVVGRPIYGSLPEDYFRAAIASPIAVAGIILAGIYVALSILPFVGLLFRRLHDIGWPGWIALIVLAVYGFGIATPASVFAMVGSVLILIIALIPGKSGDNKYGPSPK